MTFVIQTDWPWWNQSETGFMTGSRSWTIGV